MTGSATSLMVGVVAVSEGITSGVVVTSGTETSGTVGRGVGVSTILYALYSFTSVLPTLVGFTWLKKVKSFFSSPALISTIKLHVTIIMNSTFLKLFLVAHNSIKY